MKPVLALLLVFVLAVPCTADWTPGFWPGVYWGWAPGRPVMTIYGPMPRMRRVRIKVCPWWVAPPVVAPISPFAGPPGHNSWGHVQYGWGSPPPQHAPQVYYAPPAQLTPPVVQQGELVEPPTGK